MNKSGCRAGNSTASASSLHRMVFARRRVQRLTLLIHECTGRVLICSTSHHNLVHVAAGGLGCQPSGLPTALHRPGRQCLPTSHARSWYSVRRAGVQQPAHGLHQTAMPGVVLMRRQSCSTTQHACSTGCPCIRESACARTHRQWPWQPCEMVGCACDAGASAATAAAATTALPIDQQVSRCALSTAATAGGGATTNASVCCCSRERSCCSSLFSSLKRCHLTADGSLIAPCLTTSTLLQAGSPCWAP